jgi:hypothetical protein
MRKWLGILCVVFPSAMVIAHGASNSPATGHFNVEAGNRGTLLNGRLDCPAPHMMAALGRDLLFARGNIASDAEGSVWSRDIAGSNLDARCVDRDGMGVVYLARGGGPLEEEKLREDEERGNGEENGEEKREEEQQEEEGGGWDRLWDAPKLG